MDNWWIDFKEFIFGLWNDFIEFVKDIFLVIFELFLDGFAYIIEQLVPPDFVTGGLQDVINGFSPTLLYLIGETGFGEALSILGAGFAFRILRKFATLFQW
jgi:hypothetical protein